MENYIQKIHKFPCLDKSEELRLAKEGRLQDLINSNLRLVVKIARTYNSGSQLEDLIQEGNKGLIKAASEFDPEQNVSFKTYAPWWINAKILDYLGTDKTIKTPQKKKQMSKIARGIIDDYLKKNSYAPSSDYVANELNRLTKNSYSQSDIEDLLDFEKNMNTASLNKEVMSGEMIDNISNSDGRDNIVFLSLYRASKRVYNILSELNQGEKGNNILYDVLCNYKSLSEISDETGISKSKVNAEYSRGIRKLRNVLLQDEEFMDLCSDKISGRSLY
ncbi:MAG: sigma-70 family RNA polymerase sigma factor [Nanobdellota archaeon]